MTEMSAEVCMEKSGDGNPGQSFQRQWVQFIEKVIEKKTQK